MPIFTLQSWCCTGVEWAPLLKFHKLININGLLMIFTCIVCEHDITLRYYGIVEHNRLVHQIPESFLVILQRTCTLRLWDIRVLHPASRWLTSYRHICIVLIINFSHCVQASPAKIACKYSGEGKSRSLAHLAHAD